MPRTAALTLSQIHSFLDQRKQALAAIPARVQELEQEIADIEHELSMMDGGSARAPRGAKRGPKPKAMKGAVRVARKRVRPAAGSDLTSLLLKALEGSKSPMGIADLAEAVRGMGYTSTSPKFNKIVGMTLSSNKKKFKRTEPGKYTAA